MMRFVLLAILAMTLTSCGEEKSHIVGKWRTTINEEQLFQLEIPKHPDDSGLLEIEIRATSIILNGREVETLPRHNVGVWLLYEQGSNRTYSVLHKGDGRVLFRAPGHHRQGIHEFLIEPVGEISELIKE
ncbi:MAG: hypothetical protein HOL85_14545 [Rhodospirillaceae bacterium]|jgi:hypothetical protein|nr:hypothetical protein [Rhodospirillaceae bacterium]MBT6139506.1 hypothetical protein [Rhodospirillaceae bacterium]